MKYYVPIFVLIEAQDPVDAERQKQAVSALIQNGFVGPTLMGAGVSFHGATTGDPVPAPISTNPSGYQR
jgi:hypothetical protein